MSPLALGQIYGAFFSVPCDSCQLCPLYNWAFHTNSKIVCLHLSHVGLSWKRDNSAVFPNPNQQSKDWCFKDFKALWGKFVILGCMNNIDLTWFLEKTFNCVCVKLKRERINCCCASTCNQWNYAGVSINTKQVDFLRQTNSASLNRSLISVFVTSSVINVPFPNSQFTFFTFSAKWKAQM